ncbi:DUF6529 family protein [Geodermatophilus sp. URMC 64]
MFDASVVPGLKAVLATVLVVLAVYQILLMLVGYGRVRLRVLSPRAASRSHRAIGDTVAAVALTVAAVCIASFGLFATYQTRVLVHSLAGWGLLLLLLAKVAVVRWGGPRLGRLLPLLGTALLALLIVLWATSARLVLGG